MFSRFQRKHLAIPYAVFLFLFVVLPVIIVLVYAFTDTSFHFTLVNMTDFFGSEKFSTLIVSLVYGAVNTVLCLLIGYPVAMILANKKYNKNAVIVMLFVMPMWINFVIRIWAIRDLLSWVGLSGGNYPELATIIGLVYDYLPFVILPLYTTMLRMDKSQVEAASDLGAKPFQTFTRVIIPMTMPGIVSAAMMVFMPTISSYAIADILSEYKVTLFGGTIELYFKQSNWHFGSFLALVMLVLIALTTFLTSKFSRKETERANLW